jgi:hypothetical protein
MSDVVNHPPHYCQGGIECITVLEQLGLAQAYCRGNAIKYLWRMADKGKALEDAKKAQWYVNRLVGYLESEAHVPATEFGRAISEASGSLHSGRGKPRVLEDSPAQDAGQGDACCYFDTLEIQCGGGP